MRRPVIVLVVVSILVIAHAAIALGKGPASVTLTSPGTDSPVELMDAVDWPVSCDNSCPPDPMVRLMEQSGLWYATGDLPVALDQPPAELGPRHVLTWIRSGAPGEPKDSRTIRQFLYLQAPNGPLIHTPDQKSLVDWGSGVTGWFHASEDLAATLASLGAPPSQVERAGSADIGDPQRLGFFAAKGSAVLSCGQSGALSHDRKGLEARNRTYGHFWMAYPVCVGQVQGRWSSGGKGRGGTGIFGDPGIPDSFHQP